MNGISNYGCACYSSLHIDRYEAQAKKPPKQLWQLLSAIVAMKSKIADSHVSISWSKVDIARE